MDETKKYIIEFSEDPHTIRLLKLKNGDKYPVTEFKTVTPYTEPDLEQVRKEAFKNGYDAACKDIDIKSKTNAAYWKGLEDAWECVRNLGNMTHETIKEIFGCGFFYVLDDLTASEAIEKIRQYEQEKKEQIKVGDEVAFHHDDGRPDTVVVVTHIGQDGFIDGMDGRGTQYAHKNPKKWTKTGRDFPELAEALRKMREDSNE